MFRRYLAVLVSCAVVSLCIIVVQADLPTGWFSGGSHPNAYEMSVDATVAHSGGASAYLKSIEPSINGYGVLMQTFDAEKYHGQQIKMSGYVRSKDVVGWAGLWLRIKGQKRAPNRFLAPRWTPDGSLAFGSVQGSGGRSIAQSDSPEPFRLNPFDYLQNLEVKGTTDWKKYERFLYVPMNTKAIAFGLELLGTGQVWIDDFEFEVVSTEVFTLDEFQGSNPANLDFESSL